MRNINNIKTAKGLLSVHALSIGLACLMAAPAFSERTGGSGTNDAQQSASNAKRDPFWPVGYVPESAVKAVAEKQIAKSTANKDWSGAMKKVVINGVSSKGKNEFFAVINGELKGVDDTFSVQHGGTVYTWAVASIQPPGSVRLRRVSAL